MLMPALICKSQNNIQKSLNMFRDGDIIIKQQIIYKNTEQKGPDVIWNMGGIDVINKSYRLKYSTVPGFANRMAGTEHSTRYYYDMCHDTLFAGGFENNTTKIDYDIKEKHFLFPVKYGNSYSGLFHGTGTYCDKIALRCFGRYKVEADAYGKLVLPEGDTLHDVTRLHTERFVSSIHYPADSLKSISSVSFTADSIKRHIETEPYLLKNDIYKWYAKGYRYPVLETFITTAYGNEGKPYVMSFYYPPSAQQQLDYDTDNDDIRRSAPKTNKDNIVQNGFIYNLHRTGTTSVRLEYTLPSSSDVYYGIYTTDGKSVYRSVPGRQNGGIHCEEIDLSRCQDGVYILEIYMGSNHYTEKIILKR